MNIEEILAKHIAEDGAFDKDAAAKELNQELPKAFVPKHQYNEQAEKLKSATDTISQLQESNKDNAELQKEVEDYKARITELETTAAQNELKRLAENALRDAGAKDVEYALYKLGALESDGSGGVKDLDNKIKDLKETVPAHFEEKSTDPLDGYTKVDNNLKQGAQATQSDTEAMIAAMTSDLQQN